MHSVPHIVLLGGGTGSFTLLQGLKRLTPNLTAIVNMSDDGGSTGVLRDELGVLPPGDVRQCLVALSDNPEVRDLFSYRFSEGRFEGQSLGNIILSGLELRYGSFEKAIQVAGDILHISGEVLPVTLTEHKLVMENDGEITRGQRLIDDHPKITDTVHFWLEPDATINPHAARAILGADMVVLAPGSVFSSLFPILLVGGMAEALQQTKAKVVCVVNLVNKPGQTDGWQVADYIARYEQQIGSGTIDTVLYNDQEISDELLSAYAAEGEFPVGTDLARFADSTIEVIGAPMVSDTMGMQDPADKAIRRTLIRHDAGRVCRELKKLLS